MKTQMEVKDRLQTLLIAEFDRRVREASRRLPTLCQHNYRQELDARKQIAGEVNDGYNRVNRVGLPVVQSIGLCGMGMEDAGVWNGDVCDDPIDAQRCPHFQPRYDKGNLLDIFKQQVSQPEWLKANLPEVYSLLWVLDETAANFHLPWWKRVWFRFWRIRVEPVRPVGDGFWVEIEGRYIGVGPDDVFHSP